MWGPHLMWVLLGILRNTIWPQFLLPLIGNKKPLFLKWGFKWHVWIIDTRNRTWKLLNGTEYSFSYTQESKCGEKRGLTQTCCVSAKSRKPYSILLDLFWFLEEERYKVSLSSVLAFPPFPLLTHPYASLPIVPHVSPWPRGVEFSHVTTALFKKVDKGVTNSRKLLSPLPTYHPNYKQMACLYFC